MQSRPHETLYLFSGELFLTMDNMNFFFVFFLMGAARAESSIHVPKALSVYQSPESDGKILFYLQKGESVVTTPALEPGFLQIQVKRGGKRRTGYILESDLAEADQAAARLEKTWGFGLGGQYSYFTQKGKSFQTDDQVQWTTTTYNSSMSSPFLTVQMDMHDFWRLTLSQKKTSYSAAASNNGGSQTTQSVNLQQTFFRVCCRKLGHPLPGIFSILARMSRWIRPPRCG